MAKNRNIVQSNPTNSTTTDEIEVVLPAKKKREPMARVYVGGDKTQGAMLLNASVESIKNYVVGFMGLLVGAKKGYDNYWSKEDGFTNPQSIMKLTPQGLGKIIAIAQHRAALYIAAGGDKSTEMTGILSAISEYEAIAVASARTIAQDKAFSEAADALSKAMGGDIEAARKRLATYSQTLEVEEVKEVEEVA